MEREKERGKGTGRERRGENFGGLIEGREREKEGGKERKLMWVGR